MTDDSSLPAPGVVIAEGRTARVHALGADRVIKVLRPGFPDALGEEEAIAARVADAAAIGAPRFFELTRVDGRIGLVYERRDGNSMMEHLNANPWRAGTLARLLGSVHAAMHTTSAPSLPRFRDGVVAAIHGAQSIAGARVHDVAIARVETLADGTALCHGDFHPGNVMLGSAGPTIIDWLTAAAGPPAADVARTLLLLRDGALPEGMPQWRRLRIRLLRRWFVRAYLAAYRHRRELDLAEVAAWRLPTLVARLDEGIGAERAHLLRLIGRELARSPTGD